MSCEHRAADRQLVRNSVDLVILLIHQLHELSKSYRTDDERDEFDSAHEIDRTEVEARSTRLNVHSDRCNENSDEGKEHALDRIAADEPSDTCHCDKEENRHLSRSELEAELSKRRTENNEDEHADDTADAR